MSFFEFRKILSERKDFIGALSILIGYVVVRSVVYSKIPNQSLLTWSIRDNWMTVVRFGAFSLLLIVFHFIKRTTVFDFKFNQVEKAVAISFIFLFIDFVDNFGNTGEHWPTVSRVWALFTTPMVGLFEEYAFRGVILNEISKLKTAKEGILWSSALFMIFHIQAQGYSSWPNIFLIGFVLANLRVGGLSLFWLAVIHTIIDTVYFLYPVYGAGFFGIYKWLSLTLLGIFVYFTYPDEYDARQFCAV